MYDFKSVVYLLALIFLASCNTASEQAYNDELYQVSTLDALLSGNYEGVKSFDELSQKGNFGIGTFDELDGEMMAFDGKFYQIKSDGKVYEVSADMEAPFAVVTNFVADTSFIINKELSYDELNIFIDHFIPTKNIFYALRVEGDFKDAKTRSVPKQSKPYQPLIEVVKKQPTFEFNEEPGIMVGFRVPEYMKGLNVPAYHYHFMNEAKTKGGHLLECTLTKVKVSIDYIHDAELDLPNTQEFYKANLTKDRSKESDAVER